MLLTSGVPWYTEDETRPVVVVYTLHFILCFIIDDWVTGNVWQNSSCVSIHHIKPMPIYSRRLFQKSGGRKPRRKWITQMVIMVADSIFFVL